MKKEKISESTNSQICVHHKTDTYAPLTVQNLRQDLPSRDFSSVFTTGPLLSLQVPCFLPN